MAACTQLLMAGVAFIGLSQPLSLLSNKAHWPTFWHKGNWQNNLNPTHAVSRTMDAAAWMHFHRRLQSGWDQRDTDRYMFYESINKLRTHTHTRSEKLYQGPVNVGMKIGYTQGPCKRKVHCWSVRWESSAWKVCLIFLWFGLMYLLVCFAADGQSTWESE